MSPAPLYFSHRDCLRHDPRELSPAHPDTPERLIALEASLAGRDWLGWERRPAPCIDEELLELAHSVEHVRAMRELCARGGGAIDADTFVGPCSYEAALRAAGGAWELTRTLLAGEAPLGFAGVRPSGHHAEHGRAMGFCLLNNVAVAAAAAISELGLRRVFVLDWDVHHGNGTAEIFRSRSDVLFASLHQSPLYPGSGPLADTGSGAGEGYTINLPVPPGTGPGLWMALLEEVVLPAARAFEPELIIVSAGFDAHRADPLADCLLETSTFVEMALLVRELARSHEAPLALVMEGGYEPRTLAECVCAVMAALGDEQARAEPRESASSSASIVGKALEVVGRCWPLR